jgi:hypothetical protein
MIICAAIKVNFIDLSDEVQEMIICGHRHGDCLYTIVHLSKKWTNWKIQGFINHKGEFLDRKEALAHALECGQLSATHRYYQEDHNIDELYSEDLY